MMQNKDDLDEYEEHGSFRSLLLNYQFFRTLKITERSRTVQAFDVATKRDVVIKFVKDSTTKHEADHPCMINCSSLLEQKEGRGRCLRPRSCADQHMVLSALGHRNIVRQVFYKNLGGYTIICTDYFPGTIPKGGLREDDVLRVVEQLTSIAKYLSSTRISIAEINPHDILIDCKKNVMLMRLNQPSFEDQVTPLMERRYVDSILKILCFLMHGDRNACSHGASSNEDAAKRSDSAITININSARLRRIYDMLVGRCTIQALVQACDIKQDYGFKSVLLVDPTVLLKIRNLGLQCSYFDPKLVNNPSRKECYLYRLVERSSIESDPADESGASGKLLEAAIRFVPEKRALATNRLEHAECNAITRQEREKHASIKHRIGVLRDMVQHPSSLRNFMTCAKLGTRSLLYLQILKGDSFFDLMRVLRRMKVSSWRVKDVIRVKEEDMGLEIAISLCKNEWVLLSKEHGREVDFLHLASELIESSKDIE